MDDREKQKRVIIDSMVLAFAHSRVVDVVGTDALRMVLNGQYRDVTKAGYFDTRPIWELFLEQPGFDPQAAAPPLLRFKSWEQRLGTEIRLPDEFQQLTQEQIANFVSRCNVPNDELAKAWRGEAVPVEQVAAPVQKPPEPTDSPDYSFALKPQKGSLLSRVPQPVIYAASGLGLLSLAFAIWYGMANFRTPKPKMESLSVQFAGVIPVANAEKLGSQIGLFLRDEAWLNQPDADRTRQLEQALKNAPRDVTVVYVKDKKGSVRAIAQWADAKTVAVLFQ